MTSATGAEEVPFVSGMEREPQSTHEATIKVGRNLWSIDGMSHRALGMTHRVLEALGVVQSRALSLAERGPQDYEETGYERGFSAGQRHGGYHEAPKRDGGLKAVIVGCTIALISGGIVGAITFSNQFSEFRGQVLQWQKSMEAQLKQVEARLDRLENQRP